MHVSCLLQRPGGNYNIKAGYKMQVSDFAAQLGVMHQQRPRLSAWQLLVAQHIAAGVAVAGKQACTASLLKTFLPSTLLVLAVLGTNGLSVLQ